MGQFVRLVVTVVLLSSSAVMLSHPTVSAQEATPAAVASPPAVMTETLLDVVVDDLPTGLGDVALLRWTLKPSGQDLLVMPQEGPRFFVVEAGDVTITEAGRAHRLAAGEVYVADDPQQEVDLHVNGTETAHVLRGFVAKAWVSPSWDPVAHTYEWLMDQYSTTLPGGSGRLLLERLTLPAGSTLPPPEVSLLSWIGSEPGLVRKDEPVVLYRLTLIPNSTGALTPGTPTA